MNPPAAAGENRPGWQTRFQISDKPAAAPAEQTGDRYSRDAIRTRLAIRNFFKRFGTSDSNRPSHVNRVRAIRNGSESTRRAAAPGQRCLVGQTLIFLSGRERIGGDGRNGGVLNGHDRPLKRNLQHFIHSLDKMYRKGREDFLRDVRQVLLIVLRKQHCTQAHSMGGEEFFLDATDGQNLAAQRDFAGHGDIAAHGNSGKGADDGVADGDAGGRAVLGDGAFGNVYVNIDVAVEILGQAEGVGTRADVAHGGLRGFLHDVAEFSGQGEAAFAFHQGGFGGEHRAADFGPGGAGGEADFVVLLEPELAEFQDAEVIVDVGGRDFGVDLGFDAFGDDLARHFARNVLDFAFEAAHTGFVSVVANDVEKSFVGEGEILLGQAGSLARAADEEALGDFELFLLGVAGKAQDFHAVLQRLRNGVQYVGGADEHHFGKIVFDVEIVVGESVIQLGVKNFH